MGGFNKDAKEIYQGDVTRVAPGIETHDPNLEAAMDQEVSQNIIVPEDATQLPYSCLLFGANRSATAAWMTALVRLPYFTQGHSQPFKSRRRDWWNSNFAGEGIVYHHKQLKIPTGNQQAIVIKETLGARYQADYLNPVDYMLKAGYPSELLFVCTTWRHPLWTLDSWMRMGDWNWNDSFEYINKAYREAWAAMQTALENGISIFPIVNEYMLVENGPEIMMRGLTGAFQREMPIGVEYESSSIDWSDGNAYDVLIEHYQLPPDQYVLGVAGRLQNDTTEFGLRFRAKPRSALGISADQQEIAIQALEEAIGIYWSAADLCKRILQLDYDIRLPD